MSDSNIYGGLYFNPRPREEGDIVSDSNIYGGLYFNPRPREEGDQYIANDVLVMSISIHALVKRATYPRSAKASADSDFNPRPREEGD